MASPPTCSALDGMEHCLPNTLVRKGEGKEKERRRKGEGKEKERRRKGEERRGEEKERRDEIIIGLNAGVHNFIGTSSDGMRVYIGGTEVINAWVVRNSSSTIGMK
jgi:hypothetical protein